MTQAELIQVSALGKPMLHRLIKGQSFDTAMRLRYEIQRALAVYAKGKGGTPDIVQEGAIFAAGQIESWCREAFYKRRMGEILRNDGNLVLRGKKTAKWQVRREWEALAAKMAY